MTEQKALEYLHHMLNMMADEPPENLTDWRDIQEWKDEHNNIRETLEISLVALKKQIPKKIKSACMNDGIVAGYCPTCKGTVKIIPTWLRYAKGKCCDWCGQRIDWSKNAEQIFKETDRRII